MATFKEYKKYLTHPNHDLQNAPLADGSGDKAKQFGAKLADPAIDKQGLIKTFLKDATAA